MIKLVSFIGLFVIAEIKANRLLQQAVKSKCCDPDTQPGSNGNPICFEGHICCAETGEWSCSIGDGKQYPCGGNTVDITKTPEAVGKACPDCGDRRCSNEYGECQTAECILNPCNNNNGGCGKDATCFSSTCTGCTQDDVICTKQTDICQLPADVGLCDAIVPRYFYNKDTAQCESFNWGGCGGNANNFESLADCHKSCVCSLPAETGPCRASITRYFYNELTRQCEKFTYGGCRGNANNYETVEECQKTCGGKTCDDANKEYNSCGTACPVTCDKPGPTLCTLQCVEGCFCKEGLVLDANDKCVKPGDCPKQCDDANKEYKLCGSACPARCGDQGPKFCTLQCVEGCFCKAGLVLDSNGKCVKPDDCVGCGINNCISYNDGCNNCFCGDNGLARCTKRFCSALLQGPAYCTGCEEGYFLDANNECDAKVYCRRNKECDLPKIKCRPDPFCSYNTCKDDRNVCVDYNRNDKCSSDGDCDTKNGYRCVANKVCAKYM